MTLNAPIPTMPEAEFRKWLWRYWPEVSKISALAFGLPYLFGSGEDGDQVISSGTTSLTPYQIYQYKTLSIASGATLNLSGNGVMVLYVSERCYIAGTINLVGFGYLNNIGATAGSFTTSYAGAGAGGGVGLSPVTHTYNEDGDEGDTTIETGGVGGTTSHHVGYDGGDVTTFNESNFRLTTTAKDNILYMRGGGGGQGGNDGYGGTGGTGGDGGGGLLLCCPEIIIESTGVIIADGEDGNDSSTSAGGGGGAGGGSIFIFTQSYSNGGSVTANGGVGGSPGDAEADGDGGDGGDGMVIVETLPY